MNDLKFARRQLLKNPRSVVLAVLIWALGIAANTNGLALPYVTVCIRATLA